MLTVKRPAETDTDRYEVTSDTGPAGTVTYDTPKLALGRVAVYLGVTERPAGSGLGGAAGAP